MRQQYMTFLQSRRGFFQRIQNDAVRLYSIQPNMSSRNRYNEADTHLIFTLTGQHSTCPWLESPYDQKTRPDNYLAGRCTQLHGFSTNYPCTVVKDVFHFILSYITSALITASLKPNRTCIFSNVQANDLVLRFP